MTPADQAAHEAAVRTVRECFLHAEAKPLSIWAQQHTYVANLADAALVAEEAIEQIDQWAQAYPLSVFPEPDLKKARELLEAGGITLDSVSAYAMRHVITKVAEIVAPVRAAIEQARKGEVIGCS